MCEVPRYLITSADELTWKFDRPVVFLGEWCRRYDRRHVWRKMDAIVAEPYGLGQQQKDDDYAEARKLEDKLFPVLCSMLNKYHSAQHSERFWRIVLGHWVHRYVDVLLNRVKSLEECLAEHQLSGTAVYANEHYSLATLDSHSAIWAFNDDRWNLALTARILDIIGFKKLPIEAILGCESAGFRSIFLSGRSTDWKQFLRWGRKHLGRLLSLLSRDNHAFILSSYLPKKDEIKLQLALGQFPQLWAPPEIEVVAKYDRSRREALAEEIARKSDNNLENILFALIFELLPICFLEGFADLTSIVKQQPWPKHPKFIFTSNDFDTSEAFKLWSATRVEEGSKYIIGQHGNLYGTCRYRYMSVEELTADKFITWGWRDGLLAHTPAFILKAPNLKARSHNPKGGLLLIQSMYPHRINTWDTSATYLSYFRDQVKFTRGLCKEAIDILTIRLHAAYPYLNPSEEEIWYKINRAINVDTGSVNIWNKISNNKLIIHAYDSTGILETLSQNIPTLAFWQDGFENLRDSAKPSYQLLVDVGIVHLTPESAAHKVNEICDDVEGWWQQSDVKDARVRFCERYARQSQNPVRDLKKILTIDFP